MSLDRLIAAYLEQREKEGVSAATLDLATRWLECFGDFCRQRGLAAALFLTPRDIEEFESQLLWKPHSRGRFYSPNSVDQALRMVRGCLRWAMGQGWLVQDPTSDLVLGKPIQPRQRVLNRQELTRFLEAPPEGTAIGRRDRAVLALLYHVAISSPEAAALNVEDLPRLRGTSGELDSFLAARLDRYLHGARPELAGGGKDPALFLGVRGRRLGPTMPQALCARWGKVAGLGALCPRTLRRSFQAHLAEFAAGRLAGLC